MASIRFNELDRDDRGFVKLAEPRSLADLLPQPTAQPDQTIHRRPLTRGEWLTMAGLGVLLVVMVAYVMLSGNTRHASAPVAVPATLQATARIPPSPPTAAPVVMLPAYGAPNEAARWRIEATRAITPVAHFGSDWIQAQVAGSGLIWLRASDWPELGIVGSDLAPRPAEARSAPPVARPSVPTEPPPPCASAGVPGKMVEVCGYGDLAAQAKARWIEQYGGNVGVVTTPTPQEWNRP